MLLRGGPLLGFSCLCSWVSLLCVLCVLPSVISVLPSLFAFLFLCELCAGVYPDPVGALDFLSSLLRNCKPTTENLEPLRRVPRAATACGLVVSLLCVLCVLRDLCANLPFALRELFNFQLSTLQLPLLLPPDH